jgi:hypothetical protein
MRGGEFTQEQERRIAELMNARLKTTRHENADHLERALNVSKLKPSGTADHVIVSDGATAAWAAVPATGGPPTVTESGIIIPGAMSVQQAMRAIEFQAEQLRQQLGSHHHDERYQQRIPLAYTAVSFGTNWSNYGTWRTAGYAKSQDGVVHLAGLIQRAAASGADLLTLPVGHRPSAPLLFTLSAVIGGVSTIVRVDLQTTGVLQAIGFPASIIDYLSLNVIPPFIAEQ